MARPPREKSVETLTHDEATRKNIATAELQSFLEAEEAARATPPAAYPRARPLPHGERRERDVDLDPQIVWNGARIRLTKDQVRELNETGEVSVGDAQLVWRGKDSQDWSDLIVQAPPLYIQEKVHPKAIIADLKRRASSSLPRSGEGGSERSEETGGGRQRSSADAPHPASLRDAVPPHKGEGEEQPDLFADFNGLDPEARTEFYAHDQHWSNRLILGDSLQVMASLATREGLKGKVQCIYLDPPYGIKFNSNWQVSTQSRDVKDGKQTDISREPEQVKAFRDTWKDGVHSYLTYLRDRLTVARELLTESGSVFVQIGDENVHRVRALMDEVFGAENSISILSYSKTSTTTGRFIANTTDFILWYAKNIRIAKFKQIFVPKEIGGSGGSKYDQIELANGERLSLSLSEKTKFENPLKGRVFRVDNITSPRIRDSKAGIFKIAINGKDFIPRQGEWKTNFAGMQRLKAANRIHSSSNSLGYVRFLMDFPAFPLTNTWMDIGGIQSRADPKIYTVQTSKTAIERCLLMATDPGDLVLDPTCGSGTTATVAEQWGRRWITIDTSRVALALARTRLMSARYPYYLLADSPEGRAKEQQVSGRSQPLGPSHGDIRQGFVYERAPHVTLKSIANNDEIDTIWERFQGELEPLRAELNAALLSLPHSGEGSSARSAEQGGGRGADLGNQDGPHPGVAGATPSLPTRGREEGENDVPHPAASRRPSPQGGGMEEWQIPREAGAGWPSTAKDAHKRWWELRIARQREIDASIARRADVEMLYDRPYADASKVRVAGPFTVESLSPHRVLPADADVLGEDIEADEGRRRRSAASAPPQDFAAMVLENLKTSGVQGRDKADKVRFSALTPWPGRWIGAEGRYHEGVDDEGPERRAAIFIGPEFGTLARPDLVAAAREAADSRFDVLIACAFAYDAHASELTRLGPLPILQAKMNPDLHMADDLKNTGKGNLFVVFGEPDIEIERLDGDRLQVKVKGIDVFDPNTGEVRSNDVTGVAAWFIDTDYDEESFFVRHAYFLGANDPYKALKVALKAEIDEAAWATLYRDVSRPFARPKHGRIAVKVINHFGDEVMKVYGV